MTQQGLLARGPGVFHLLPLSHFEINWAKSLDLWIFELLIKPLTTKPQFLSSPAIVFLLEDLKSSIYHFSFLFFWYSMHHLVQLPLQTCSQTRPWQQSWRYSPQPHDRAKNEEFLPVWQTLNVRWGGKRSTLTVHIVGEAPFSSLELADSLPESSVSRLKLVSMSSSNTSPNQVFCLSNQLRWQSTYPSCLLIKLLLLESRGWRVGNQISCRCCYIMLLRKQTNKKKPCYTRCVKAGWTQGVKCQTTKILFQLIVTKTVVSPDRKTSNPEHRAVEWLATG